MAEMLLQSQWTVQDSGKDLRLVSLLPALPKEWPAGSVKGLCARDGFVVDIAWEKGEITRVVLHSKLGRPCRLQAGDHEATVQTGVGKTYAFDGRLQAEQSP